MTDLIKAKQLLAENLTCVLVKGDEVITSTKSGIAPVLGLIEEGVNLEGFSVADKIVGKAAAMLFVKAKIKSVFAQVLSEEGEKFLKSNGIDVEFDKKVQFIINRAGNGICPMEATVKDVDDFEEGFLALKNKVAELKKVH